MFGTVIIGILAGFIATKLSGGESKGCIINLLLGLVGSAVGGWIFSQLRIPLSPGWVGELITGTLGAILVLWVWNKVMK